MAGIALDLPGGLGDLIPPDAQVQVSIGPTGGPRPSIPAGAPARWLGTAGAPQVYVPTFTAVGLTDPVIPEK
jgi:hypothetical protein